MRVAIVANGSLNNDAFHRIELKKADKIICADGGANSLDKMGMVPDYVIGDMDSIGDELLDKLKKKIKAVIDLDQDKTDLMKAISLAQTLKPNEIVIYGAIGDNIDHTLSNLICLDKIEKKIKARIVDEKNDVELVEKEIEISGKKGDIISVLPLTDVEGLNYEGLKWDVKDKDVSFGWLGTRNEMTGKGAKISLREGKILVIRVRE